MAALYEVDRRVGPADLSVAAVDLPRRRDWRRLRDLRRRWDWDDKAVEVAQQWRC